ncbi:amidase signature domain-containing protein [Echria macrotheca]|uniref:Amidase signature domain-containing protein n=1 Tax=Echria macrotheca TaxID=438768 RepID=A0AAJ0F8K9_9PEZI|nr:amidase signature domain-containing protein [Echria macrotheca]
MPLKVVQPVPLPKGTDEYEAKIKAILDDFAAKVPDSLVLPESITSNPPKDVTSVPRDCGLLAAEELDITEKYDAVGLAEAIASKKLTAVAVATAFAKRAIIAHQVTCCLTEWFMDEALERAKFLDDYLEKNGKTIGPLHGVPISVKEHQALAGHYTSFGWLDTRTLDKEDAQMVRIFRNAGAVFYVKTTQPQGIMHLEGVSQYGRTLNPYNINLSSGGSTAGEAALIAMRGSVLGIGTDIGGSIRGPSGFCGIYGFKPTSYYLPMKDFLVGGFGAELNVLCSTGPMCNTMRDMDLFVKVIKDANPHIEDPRLVPIPWKGLSAATPKTPLKIGIMWHDGNIIPQPPVTRALEWAVSKLTQIPGVEVKNFAPFQTKRGMDNIRKAYWPDGGAAVKAHLAATGEPMFPLTQWIIKDAEGGDIGSAGVLAQRVERDNFRIEYSAHWAAQDVDVLLCPMFIGPACEHDTSFYWNYTAFFNYVDHPGVVFPTPVKALAKGAEDYRPENATPISEEDKHVRKLWAKGDFEGAPIDLQMVARKYYDNELFSALAQVKEALGLP